MNLSEFIDQYGEFVSDYKQYENGNIRITFSENEKVMWLKGIVCEKMGYSPITHSGGRSRNITYWFEPAN